MKTDLQIIKTILYNFLVWDKNKTCGFCYLIGSLYEYNYLTYEEYDKARKLLKKQTIKHNGFRNDLGGYWFVGKEARINFLCKAIDDLEGTKTRNPNYTNVKVMLKSFPEALPF